MLREYDIKQVYQGRLETDDDLLVELTRIAKQEGIKAGKVSAIGAVKKANISYYNQKEQAYQQKEFTQSLEILNLIGNISLKDGEPIVHAHISLGDDSGKVYGGHLEEGTTVFACEFIIEEYQGEAWQRSLDSKTGLPLWSKE